MGHFLRTKGDPPTRQCSKPEPAVSLGARNERHRLVPVAIAFPLFFILLFREHWSFLPAWGLFLLVLSLSAIAMFAGVIAGRVRLYRKLVKLEMRKGSHLI